MSSSRATPPGGGLVLSLLHRLRDHGDKLPAAGVLISPLLDLTGSGASFQERADQDPIFSPDLIRGVAETYLGGADPRDPAASPLFASQACLPPLLIQTGGAEILLSDSERLAAATAAGTDVVLDVADELPHVYHGAVDTPESIAAVRQIAEFVHRADEHRGGRPSSTA
ncbi:MULTISPECIES: alpha/beta hydrolase fold domain-containing protein [Frankia]|uniref:Hydrolase n=1 Tax=Frankia casuarinae (strain DSM 45818 / CECT 9043 / HFP020203 / CcI3) TaxID=106370 RepID=Q2J9W3_FRACC|nr:MULTISPECIES: alpha/beta hydrolase fold domain-containing protein [Frankia]ABD11929.1 putative hydrolase [Frankia casuarinae]ESZ99908.1 hypothetical protein CcI6DRAFT_04689 [Frankia sp. CcI6]OHV49044.1 hypothetical protein CgIS1_21530 [Frankia sp. CgIS1]ORT47047.1 hypothetical protein KBI5_21905 [Frankia sp. KB5]